VIGQIKAIVRLELFYSEIGHWGQVRQLAVNLAASVLTFDGQINFCCILDRCLTFTTYPRCFFGLVTMRVSEAIEAMSASPQ
jgi:hypothetical protein